MVVASVMDFRYWPFTDAGRAFFMAGGYVLSFGLILAGCFAANLLETDYSHNGVILIVILYLLTIPAVACAVGFLVSLILLAIFAAVYHHGVPARCMPPAETLQIWEAYF